MVIAEGEIADRFQLKSVIVPVKIRSLASWSTHRRPAFFSANDSGPGV
jgi:hypothetical protein